MQIAISTLAFKKDRLDEAVEFCRQNDFYLEFSSSLGYIEGIEDFYKNADCKRIPHNYFPAPKDPFVVNLASLDEGIRQRSIDMAIKGMELATLAGAPFYSIHAGFCLDPAPGHLGSLISAPYVPERRSEHYDVFLESIREVLKNTTDLDARLLIENNVLKFENFKHHNANPFFCVDPEEMNEVVREINDERFGLLLDTAHLKVSARTLGFSREKAVEQIQQSVDCIHHSDNNGEVDNNQPIDKDYWFLENIPKFRNLMHVVEVKNLTEKEINRQVELLLNAS